MRKILQARPVRRTLRRNQLKGYWFMHGSMFGSYKRPCYIVKDHHNGMVTIEYFDPYVNDYLQQEIQRDKLTFA